MAEPRILPITGDHFEDFLILSETDSREKELPKAWRILEQQTRSHVSSGSVVDLNRIYVDLARLQMLAYPIVEDWKRPLSNKEWQQIEEQSKELEQQMDRMRKLSVEVRKKGAESFSQVAPLFNQLFEQNQELRKNWNRFKQTWTVYKQQWKRFQEEQEEAEKKNKSRQSSSEDKEAPEPPKPPQMFQRERWHALRTTTGLLEVELQQQSSEGSRKNQDFQMGIEYLVDQLRDIYVQTQGFELLEKVKLVQERNTQLIAELQQVYPEPIITASLKEQAQAAEQNQEDSEETQPEKKAAAHSWKKNLLLALGIVAVGVLVVVFIHSPVVKDRKVEKKTLEFRPKGKTITTESPAKEPELINLSDMINSFNLDIPVVKPDERLLQLIGQNKEKAEQAANSLLEELGRKVTFAFAQANSYFLYWKGQISRFSDTREMRKMMRKLDKQKAELQALMRDWGEEAPKDAEIVPENLDGEPVYGLEMLDENGEPLQIYVNPDGVRMRLSNGQFLEKTYPPDEALKRVRQ